MVESWVHPAKHTFPQEYSWRAIVLSWLSLPMPVLQILECIFLEYVFSACKIEAIITLYLILISLSFFFILFPVYFVRQ